MPECGRRLMRRDSGRRTPFLYSPRGRARPRAGGSPGRRRSSRSRPGSRASSASSARSSPPTTSASTGTINAFTVAFQVPNLDPRARRRRRALVRVRPRLQRAAREGRARARLARRVERSSGSCCSGSSALTALFILLAPLVIMPVRRPGGDDDLAVTLSRILFPIVVLLGLSGIVVGILNSYEHFTVPGADAGRSGTSRSSSAS